MKLTALVASMALCIMLWMQTVAHAVVFSIDAASPSGVSAADLLTGGTPQVAFTAASLGLVPADDIDAVSFGPFVPGALRFSVDRNAVGAPGTGVNGQAALNQAAGDIFQDPTFANTNSQLSNQDQIGLLPNIPFTAPAMPPIDDLDALDMDNASLADPNDDGIPDRPIWFSLTPNSPSLLAGGVLAGGSPADIFVTVGGGPPTVAVPAGVMGGVAGDDIDALALAPPLPPPALLGPGFIFISLAPGSPALAALGITAADIIDPFLPGIGQQVVLFGPTPGPNNMSTVGLIAGDNLNAGSSSPVPEPSTLLLLASGLVGMGALTRRRSRPKGA